MKLSSNFDVKDIRLPLKFIMTGIVLFVISQAVLLSDVNALSLNMARTPVVWAAVHLLILGFAVMVTMGAMYQLVPVALQVQIYSIRLGHVQFAIYTLGVIGIGWSFLDFSPLRLFIFSLITLFGILLFEVNLWLSIRGAKKTEICLAIKISLLYFFLTIILGIWLALDFLIPHLHVWHERFLIIHIIFGTIGWFTLLIVGFSYKLIPMFTLSHGYESKLTQYAIQVINSGILLITVGSMSNLMFLIWLGASCILVGITFFILQIRLILKHRLKKKLDLGLKVALFSWIYSICLVIASAGVSYIFINKINMTVLVYIVLVGWITLSILGYLFKILPFLWWTYRYSDKIGIGNVPSLKEMINEKTGKWIFIFMILCITVSIVAMLFDFVEILFISQLIQLISSFLYLLETIKIFKK